MKKFLTSALVYVFFVYSLTSCKPDKAEPSRDYSQSSFLEVQDGILVFSSEDKFDKTLSFLKTLRTKGSLEEWESQYVGFKSMRTAYNQLKEQDYMIIDGNNSAKGYEQFLSIIGEGNDRQAVRNVMDDALATLTNHNGLVKVGGKYRLYRYDATVEFLDNKITNDPNLYTVKSSDVTRNIRVIPTQRTIRTTVISSDVVNGYEDRQGPLNEYWSGNRKHRVVGIIYCDGPPTSFNSIGGTTKHQKRVFGSIWYDNDVSSIRLKYDAVVRVGANGGQDVTVNYDFTVNNQGYYNYSQSVVVGGNAQNFTIISFTGYHWASCADGVGRDVNVSW